MSTMARSVTVHAFITVCLGFKKRIQIAISGSSRTVVGHESSSTCPRGIPPGRVELPVRATRGAEWNLGREQVSSLHSAGNGFGQTDSIRLDSIAAEASGLCLAICMWA